MHLWAQFIIKEKSFYELSMLGPGFLQVNSKSLQSQGLFQISKRPGPGAYSYNCNGTTTHPPNNHETSEWNNNEISSHMNLLVI